MKTYTLILAIFLLTGCAGMEKNGALGNSYNYYNNGEYNEAIAKIDRALSKHQYSEETIARLLFLKAESYLKLGDSSSYIAVHKYVLKKYPETEGALKSSMRLSELNCEFEKGQEQGGFQEEI